MHFVKNLSAVGVTASFSLFFASGKTFFYTSEIYLFYTRLSFQLYFHIYVVTAGLKISEHLDTIVVFLFCEVASCKKKKQEKHSLVSLFVRRHWRLDFVFGYLKVFRLISKMHPKWGFFLNFDERWKVFRQPRTKSIRPQLTTARVSDPEGLRTFSHIESGGFLLSHYTVIILY